MQFELAHEFPERIDFLSGAPNAGVPIVYAISIDNVHILMNELVLRCDALVLPLLLRPLKQLQLLVRGHLDLRQVTVPIIHRLPWQLRQVISIAVLRGWLDQHRTGRRGGHLIVLRIV